MLRVGSMIAYHCDRVISLLDISILLTAIVLNRSIFESRPGSLFTEPTLVVPPGIKTNRMVEGSNEDVLGGLFCRMCSAPLSSGTRDEPVSRPSEPHPA